MSKTQIKRWTGIGSYIVSVVLCIVGFVWPPTAIIDGSVLIAVSVLIAGQQLLFGDSIKTLNIDKTGIHLDMKEGA